MLTSERFFSKNKVMSPLYFITGNKKKLAEARAIFPAIEGIEIDLPEIQSLDPREVIRAKLDAALAHHPGPFIVEDTSLTVHCMNGLPGTLIKWFLETIGAAGVARIAESFGDARATACTMIGYADGKNVEFFQGVVHGTVVAPRGVTGFGWDVIFIPEGHDRTFAEMTVEEKNAISMRRIAFEGLKAHLGTSFVNDHTAP